MYSALLFDVIGINFPPRLKAVDFRYVSELLVKKKKWVNVNSWKRGMKLEATANFLNDFSANTYLVFWGTKILI